MPFRFRKSKSILPGVRLNVGLGGVSATLGGPAGRVNLSKRGVTAGASLPGTGISYNQRIAAPGGSMAQTQTYAPANSKSVAVAYILLVLFSGFGIHRFYLGRPISAIVMLLITLSGFLLGFTFFIALAWVILDLFLIPGMARR